MYRCNLRFQGSNHLNSWVVLISVVLPLLAMIWIGLSYTVVVDLTALHNDEHSVHLIFCKLFKVIE